MWKTHMAYINDNNNDNNNNNNQPYDKCVQWSGSKGI